MEKNFYWSYNNRIRTGDTFFFSLWRSIVPLTWGSAVLFRLTPPVCFNIDLSISSLFRANLKENMEMRAVLVLGARKQWCSSWSHGPTNEALVLEDDFRSSRKVRQARAFVVVVNITYRLVKQIKDPANTQFLQPWIKYRLYHNFKTCLFEEEIFKVMFCSTPLEKCALCVCLNFNGIPLVYY